MRVKPARVKPDPLSPVPDCQPSPRQTNSYIFKADPEKAVQDLVERRVRSSLRLVQSRELTPAQALRAVVNSLADELTDSQYQHLVFYFRSKEIKGQLAPAKQLLLRYLTSAKSCLPATGTRDQQQQTSYSSKANSAAAAVGGLTDRTNTHKSTDQGFYSSSNQTENWDAAKQPQFVPVQQQQQVCGIKAAVPWPSTGAGILRLDL